ncbi:hypothetical protein CA13_18570 [Planctomycetes bacterium CA13]|uniref:Uncharacterized protein n=1 Tax=Novipirellula herctigrandis TaxID=2527986 RepID=A0A5C5YZR9_9BACT|nr:hypothetical protein CA13_18570 [Planctomycetes bacterium CA13]
MREPGTLQKVSPHKVIHNGRLTALLQKSGKPLRNMRFRPTLIKACALRNTQTSYLSNDDEIGQSDEDAVDKQKASFGSKRRKLSSINWPSNHLSTTACRLWMHRHFVR